MTKAEDAPARPQPGRRLPALERDRLLRALEQARITLAGCLASRHVRPVDVWIALSGYLARVELLMAEGILDPKERPPDVHEFVEVWSRIHLEVRRRPWLFDSADAALDAATAPPPWPQRDPSEDIEQEPAYTRKRRRAEASTRADLRRRVQTLIEKLPELIASGWTEIDCAGALGIGESTLRRNLNKHLGVAFPRLREAYAVDETVDAVRKTLEDAARDRGLLN